MNSTLIVQPDATLLSILFQDGIYFIPDIEKNKQFVFHGNNLKNIVFLIDIPLNQFISSPNFDSLGKILTALKLDFDDIALFSTKDYSEITLVQIIENLNPKVLIAMGSNPKDDSEFTNHSDYSICIIKDLVLMRTPSFKLINTADEMKRQFWTAIKTILTNREH